MGAWDEVLTPIDPVQGIDSSYAFSEGLSEHSPALFRFHLVSGCGIQEDGLWIRHYCHIGYTCAGRPENAISSTLFQKGWAEIAGRTWMSFALVKALVSVRWMRTGVVFTPLTRFPACWRNV